MKQIGPEIYTYVSEEEVERQVDKFLGQLSNDAAPGPAGLRNTHLKMWMGPFASKAAETAIGHLEDFITDMANDKMPPWFMQAMQGADLMAIIKSKGAAGRKADHRPVMFPNTLSKVADKVMMEDAKEEHTRELLPHQLVVGVKFAAELLAMGIMMILRITPDSTLIIIDLKNAYNAICRAAVIERHYTHRTLRRTVPYWRAKLGPRSSIWAEDTTM
jgi:hypothetical protein